MVASICGNPAVASVADVKRLVFKQPGSFALNLEGYFSECSQGQASLNSSNSLVVGSVDIPCSYSGVQPDGSAPWSQPFETDSCAFRDNDAWHVYAQSYVTVSQH